MEDIRITKSIGSDKKINYIVSGLEQEKLIVDRETVLALQWQLMKEKMGIAFPPADLRI